MALQENEVQEAPDRREAIEAAFNQAETVAAEPATEQAAPATQEPVETTTAAPATTDTPAEPVAPTVPAAEDTQPVVPDSRAVDIERPPQAWKAPLKAKWSTLDPDVRQEVMRRERETTQVLNDTAQARQLAQSFVQAIQPFQQRLNQLGAHPIQAMSQLLKADQFLSSAPAQQRAKYMAQLIKGYGVDIAELDQALAAAPAADQVATQVEQLVQQRMAPIQAFMQQQTAAQRQQAAENERVAAQTIAQMAQDSKYPFFERVRTSMADLIEFSASKGQPLTIEAAYNKAIALDSVLSQEVANRNAKQAAQVQRALNASSSISGNPGGAVRPGPSATDRRATIEAALNAAEGR